VVKKVQKKGFKISQMDSVVIAERPKLLEYRVRIQKKLARLLKISIGQVSVKAKTNEGLDSIGGKKAIAAWAVSLVEKVKAK
jgi:2-C-methyl-D-erythritol 2,4-cyclodiphosphate synthase